MGGNHKDFSTAQVQPATQIYLLCVVSAKPYLLVIYCISNISTLFLNIELFQTFNKSLKIEILFVQCGDCGCCERALSLRRLTHTCVEDKLRFVKDLVKTSLKSRVEVKTS